MDFRPGSVEMVVIGGLTFLGACFAAWVASGLRVVGSDTPQFVLALAGLLPALATLLEASRRRGHPGIWFCVTVAVYAVWLACVVWQFD